MREFNKEEYIQTSLAAFETLPKINEIVDKLSNCGYDNLFLVGVGGSLSFHMQMAAILKANSHICCFTENACELTTTGNPALCNNSVAVFHSRSGDTKELLDAARYAKEKGAKVVSFVEKTASPMAEISDYVVPGVGYYYLYLFYTYLMYKEGDFQEYPDFIENFKKFPAAFAKDLEANEDRAHEIGEMYGDAPFTYVISAGNLWGWAYSFAMCVMEETMWMATKSIHAAEFFHGTLEMIERDSYVLLLRGEDASRPMVDRVENFANRVCRNVTVIDTTSCPLEGIDATYRNILSPIVMEFLCRRISAHFEEIRKHPCEIRRYYRALSY